MPSAFRNLRRLNGHSLPDDRYTVASSASPRTDISRLDVGPPLLFQLHYAHDAGLDHLCLRNDRYVLFLGLVHVLLSVAAGFERNLRRSQCHPLHPSLHPRGIVPQPVPPRPDANPPPCHLLTPPL